MIRVSTNKFQLFSSFIRLPILIKNKIKTLDYVTACDIVKQNMIVRQNEKEIAIQHSKSKEKEGSKESSSTHIHQLGPYLPIARQRQRPAGLV